MDSGILKQSQASVVVEGEESDSVPVTSGVLQGSVLGPILFLAYINDLTQDIVSQVRIFADDTAIYLTVESNTDSDCLQKDLDQLQAWESKLDMEFNPSKCQEIHVTASRTPFKTEYILHYQVLESVSSTMYVGAIWDPHTKENAHKWSRDAQPGGPQAIMPERLASFHCCSSWTGKHLKRDDQWPISVSFTK